MKNNVEYNRNWRKRNPLKVRAHIAVNYAVRRGVLVKQCCEVCGSEKAHAHHDDYSKPLDVRWLCHIHHEDAHHGEDRPSNRRKICGENGITAKYQPAPKRDLLLEHAVTLRSSGMSFKQIATKLGVSKGTAFKWLTKPAYK